MHPQVQLLFDAVSSEANSRLWLSIAKTSFCKSRIGFTTSRSVVFLIIFPDLFERAEWIHLRTLYQQLEVEVA